MTMSAQPASRLPSARPEACCEVERDAALAGVEVEEEPAQLRVRVVVRERRVRARAVAAPRRLGADHVGAEGGQQLGAERPGDALGEIEDAQIVERRGVHGRGVVRHLPLPILPAALTLYRRPSQAAARPQQGAERAAYAVSTSISAAKRECTLPQAESAGARLARLGRAMGDAEAPLTSSAWALRARGRSSAESASRAVAMKHDGTRAWFLT